MFNLYLSIANEDFQCVYIGKDIYTAIRIIADNCDVLDKGIYTDADILFAYMTDSFGNIVFESCYNKGGI